MKQLIYLFAVLLMAAGVFAGEISLTVYNNNRALAHEIRMLEAQKGTYSFDFLDIPAEIDPTSVRFKADGLEILEQNFEYDVLSREKIVQKMLGYPVIAKLTDETLIEGILNLADGSGLTVTGKDGKVTLICRDQLAYYQFPQMPEGFVDKPTLKWLLDSKAAGAKKAEISYLTKGMNWHAEYIAVVKEKEKKIGFTGWVSIDNKCGKTFENAKLKLMAGEVNVVQERQNMRAKAEMAVYSTSVGADQFQEKGFFEYHLYTLQRPATVRNNQIKQIALFPEAEADYTKEFIYQASMGDKVGVYLKFTNSKTAGLGMALPAGKIRVYQADDDGSQEFIGEDMIDHTPKDEKVKLQIGSAFDIVGERQVTDSRQLGKYDREEDIEIKLRNHKTTPVTVTVVENFYGNWDIRNATHTFTKVSANTAEFKIDLPVHKEGEETVLKFTMRYSRY